MILSALFCGFGLAALLIYIGFVPAQKFIFWFSLAAANICNIIRMFTPEKKKPEIPTFEFEEK